MRYSRSISTLLWLAFVVALLRCKATPGATVELISDESDAVVALLRREADGQPPPDADWHALFVTRGYAHLQEREAAMHRPLTDSAFRAFVESDTLRARAEQLTATVRRLEQVDVEQAAQRAQAYLPRGTPLRARLYLEIKPQTNSFVFRGRDSIPSIFLYVRTSESPAQLENTLAHELHHIGLEAACSAPAESTRATPKGTLVAYLGALGEGLAMLAAAGSPHTHPHAADDDSIKRRWDRDVANAPADIAALASFFTDVMDGRITSRDSVEQRAQSYFGVQGPWYTVGWLMASTVEQRLGRDSLIALECQPAQLIAAYNTVVAEDTRLPRWPDSLVRQLTAAVPHIARAR